jgi:arabinose-5-phosphate isomerase
MKDALFEMTGKRLGLTTVVDGGGRLLGIISDGDVRRQLERHGYALLDKTAGECMTREPVVIGRRELATAALDLMESRKITSLLIVDGGSAVEGVIHLHDLWKTEMI